MFSYSAAFPSLEQVENSCRENRVELSRRITLALALGMSEVRNFAPETVAESCIFFDDEYRIFVVTVAAFQLHWVE
jgi:hypothetical protein